MILTKNAAIVSMMGLLMALTAPAQPAYGRANAKAVHTVAGTVVNHKGKAVSGARVHVAHHRKHRTSTATATATQTKAARTKAARAGVRRGATSAADGTFHMKHRHSGTITLVAHKKGVGSGHVRVAAGTNLAGVTIRLHKHHHSHS